LWAITVGQAEAVKLLLVTAGFEPDSKNPFGRTPLSYAAKKGHTNIVEPLLSAGAEPDTSSRFSRTPLSYAGEGGHIGTAKFFLAVSRVLTQTQGTRMVGSHSRGLPLEDMSTSSSYCSLFQVSIQIRRTIFVEQRSRWLQWKGKSRLSKSLRQTLGRIPRASMD
jgi:Ankyrin repeats (3 copies)